MDVLLAEDERFEEAATQRDRLAMKFDPLAVQARDVQNRGMPWTTAAI